MTHIINSTVYRRKACMNEKIYKAMNFAGIASIAVGVVVTIVGITAGIITIVSGARLLKWKKGLTF